MLPLYKIYECASPVGYYTMCNTFALVILDINDDIAVAAFTQPAGQPGYWNIRRHKISYTYTGRPYIRKGGMRFYFDQIIRTEVC